MGQSKSNFVENIRTKLSETKALIVGDVMLDQYWYANAERISPEAPVPILDFVHEIFQLGGAGNVAANVKGLGLQTSLLAIIANDNAGELINKLLVSKDIMSHLLTDTDGQTTVKTRTIVNNQYFGRIDRDQKSSPSSSCMIFEKFCEIIDDYDLVIFSDYNKGTLIQIEELIAFAKQRGKAVFVSPKAKTFAQIKDADHIILNERECLNIIEASNQDLKEGLESFKLKQTLPEMLITCSERGIMFCRGDEITEIASQVQKLTDVTGAIDSVVAIYSALTSLNSDNYWAATIANKGGGIAVSKLGTIALTLDDLQLDD